MDTIPPAVLSRSSTLRDGAPQSFWGLVDWRAEQTPDALFAVDSPGRRLTFAGYREAVESAAGMLTALGIAEGTVVGWQLPTWIDSLILMGALARVSAVQIPILPVYREQELGHVLDQTSPDVLFVPALWRGYDYAALATSMQSSLPDLKVVVVDHRLPDFPVVPPPPPAPDPSAVRWIYYTTGTTGKPKGARHTDAGIVAAGHSLTERLDIHASDRATIAYPVTHVGGAFMIASGLITGCAHVCIENFVAAESIPRLQEEGVTFPGNGTAFELAYLAAQREQPGVPIFPLARAFPHGGDPKRPHIHQALRDEIGGVGNISGYGLTEFPMIAAGDVRDTKQHLAERVGRPCSEIDVRIVDHSGGSCLSGVEGEILARGPSLCLGYVDESANAGAFEPDGFFHTGDLGFLDDEGYLEVTGRLKDLIFRKGEKISAAELEEILHAHPKIAEVTVIGLPDEERGELCCAVVVLRDPGDSIDLAEIGELILSKGLMRQKVPERLEIRDTLPRDFFGKVKKTVLRDELT
jgi:acyl-CoA synthetase (AMP-forming)/AMP-acid ligase II